MDCEAELECMKKRWDDICGLLRVLRREVGALASDFDGLTSKMGDIPELRLLNDQLMAAVAAFPKID